MPVQDKMKARFGRSYILSKLHSFFVLWWSQVREAETAWLMNRLVRGEPSAWCRCLPSAGCPSSTASSRHWRCPPTLARALAAAQRRRSVHSFSSSLSGLPPSASSSPPAASASAALLSTWKAVSPVGDVAACCSCCKSCCHSPAQLRSRRNHRCRPVRTSVPGSAAAGRRSCPQSSRAGCRRGMAHRIGGSSCWTGSPWSPGQVCRWAAGSQASLSGDSLAGRRGHSAGSPSSSAVQ